MTKNLTTSLSPDVLSTEIILNESLENQINLLPTKILDCVVVDYATFNFIDEKSRQWFVDYLSRHFTLKIFDFSVKKFKFSELDAADQRICLSLGYKPRKGDKFKPKVKKVRETKYDEISYDLILVDSYGKRSCRIPGKMAHSVMALMMESQHFLNAWKRSFSAPIEKNVTLSRLDAMLVPPGFNYTNFKSLFDLLLDFNSKQHLQHFEYCLDKNFAIGYTCYNGKRTYRCFVRVYVSESGPKLRFELEMKNHSAKRYEPYVLHGDFFNFNRMLILEILLKFETIVKCEFTRPLHEWIESTVKPIKNRLFPNDRYYGKTVKNKEKEFRKGQSLTKRILLKKNLAVNLELYKFEQPESLLNNEKSLEFLTVCFCTKLLLNHWLKKGLSENEIKSRFHLENFNSELLPINFVDYKISFKAVELVEFLNLKYRAESKKKIVNVLKKISNEKNKFSYLNPVTKVTTEFYDPIFYSLGVDSYRGNLTKVTLILHPITVGGLLYDPIVFPDKLYKEYMLIFKKHKSKKEYSFTYSLFAVFLDAFHYCDPRNIKKFIAKRPLKKLKQKKMQLFFFYETVKLFHKFYPQRLGLKFDDETFHVMDYETLSMIYLYSTNSILDCSEFIFSMPVEKIQNEETSPELIS